MNNLSQFFKTVSILENSKLSQWSSDSFWSVLSNIDIAETIFATIVPADELEIQNIFAIQI